MKLFDRVIVASFIRVLTVLPTDSVLVATRKMLEIQISSAIVTVGNKPYGILTQALFFCLSFPFSISVERLKCLPPC